ncbi:MAG: cytochrome O ubiquinol oxidase, partial [Methylococcaceae bacterium]|nr:cytochrome O ubiquinol oxidase [Methylococcaceae bacterium]
MEDVTQFIDFFLHLDKYLSAIIQSYGHITYLILFIIIFCETGLVVLPFLPGDSLLFAAGAFAAKGDMSIGILYVILCIAAVLGDSVNYEIG